MILQVGELPWLLDIGPRGEAARHDFDRRMHGLDRGEHVFIAIRTAARFETPAEPERDFEFEPGLAERMHRETRAGCMHAIGRKRRALNRAVVRFRADLPSADVRVQRTQRRVLRGVGFVGVRRTRACGQRVELRAMRAGLDEKPCKRVRRRTRRSCCRLQRGLRDVARQIVHRRRRRRCPSARRPRASGPSRSRTSAAISVRSLQSPRWPMRNMRPFTLPRPVPSDMSKCS